MITPIQSSNIGNHKGNLLTKCDVIADIEHCSHLSTINTLMTNQRNTLSLRYIHDKCHFTNEFVIDCQSGRYCTTYNKDYRSASNSNSILRYLIYYLIMISFSSFLVFLVWNFDIWYLTPINSRSKYDHCICKQQKKWNNKKKGIDVVRSLNSISGIASLAFFCKTKGLQK